MDSPRHVSKRLANQAWTHRERTSPEANQHPASWTVRAMPRVSTGSTTSSTTRRGLIASRQIPKPTNTPPHGQPAPCEDSLQAEKLKATSLG
ncbi:MAG: hypothetical protein ACOYZ6_15145 [Chloroflexota bacterium]